MSKLIHNANETRKRIRENDDSNIKQIKKNAKSETITTSTKPTSDLIKTKTNKKNAVIDTDNKVKEKTNIKEDKKEAKTNSKEVKKVKTNIKDTKGTKNNSNKKNATKSLLKSNEESNVIYLGHIPNGFDEKAMKQYFKQFGDVKKVKLFRSMKTNRSKGYAFIQFEDHEVASIVAEAMDGYMMFERQLVCHVVPKEKCHSGMFKKPKVKVNNTNNDDNNDDDDDDDKNDDDDDKK
jgi:nucleolar protein 15